jgi:hypothetical protein
MRYDTCTKNHQETIGLPFPRIFFRFSSMKFCFPPSYKTVVFIIRPSFGGKEIVDNKKFVGNKETMMQRGNAPRYSSLS